MDDVDDILYGNIEEAPMIESLVSSPTEKPMKQPLIPEEKVIPTQTPMPQPEVEKEVAAQPVGSSNRGGLLDPNVSKQGKMFIGGLSWETTDEGLRKYMQVYGEIEDVLIMKDSLTNRSRGFAFLTFKDPSSIDKVLLTDHYIDGKKIDPKRAVPKDEYERAEKVFVGGVHADISEKEFRDFFEKFGNVTEATIMFDRNTGRPRGFGFVTFSSWDGVQKVLDMQASRGGIFLMGKRMEVKPASLRKQPLGATYPVYGMPGTMPVNTLGYNTSQNSRSPYAHSPSHMYGAEVGSQDGYSSDRNVERRRFSNPEDDIESAKSLDYDGAVENGGVSRYRHASGGDRLHRERHNRYERYEGHYEDRDWDDERYERDRPERGRQWRGSRERRR